LLLGNTDEGWDLGRPRPRSLIEDLGCERELQLPILSQTGWSSGEPQEAAPQVGQTEMKLDVRGDDQERGSCVRVLREGGRALEPGSGNRVRPSPQRSPGRLFEGCRDVGVVPFDRGRAVPDGSVGVTC
jgi:hypothetical protein